MKENATVIITRYNESDNLVLSCLMSLVKQNEINLDIKFLDQIFSKKIKKECKSLTNKKIKIHYIRIPKKSLSFARNMGIKLAKTDLVLFTDCDAMADKNWAREIFNTFEKNKKTGIVGGKSIPKWLGKKKWYHNSNIILELYSLIDLGSSEKEVQKVVGVNFSINKKRLKKLAKFKENLGRKDGKLLGGEETDLCQKIIMHGFKVIYNPFAKITHQIPKDRMSINWVIKRIYYGGISRSMRGGKPKTFSKKRNFYDKLILPLFMIPYIIGYIKGKLK